MIVFHVVSPESHSASTANGNDLKRDSDILQSCWVRLKRLRELVNDFSVDFHVTIGRTVSSIVQVAQRERCDLIVLAGHRRSFQHYQLYGSLSESLERQTSCPILILRQSPFQQQPRRILDGLTRELQTA